MTLPSPRYPEIDLLRTVAILSMVVYHAAFDLDQLYGWDWDVLTGYWRLFARATAILFLLVSGMSFAISWDRSPRWSKAWKRAIVVLGAGVFVSGATYAISPDDYVRFGILHLIGAAALLLPLMASLKEGNFFFGILFIWLGTILGSMRIDTSLLLPLGLMPHEFVTLDYFPIAPWFGVLLIGSGLGHLLYIRSTVWRKHLPSLVLFPSYFVLFSHHSLLIYLLHQPLLILLLTLLFGWPESW